MAIPTRSEASLVDSLLVNHPEYSADDINRVCDECEFSDAFRKLWLALHSSKQTHKDKP